MDMRPIKIALADDHKLMRQGLIEFIDGFGGFEIVIEALDGDDLIKKLINYNDTPDICMLDISMPGKNGYDTMKELKKCWPELKVLVISMHETEYSVLQMLKLGAKGYLCKIFSSSEQLRMALMSVYENGYYHSDSVGLKASKALNAGNSFPNITEQEMIFLKHSCSDLSYDEIAELMNVSKRTVEGYRDSIFQRLGIKNRNALTLFAVKNGIVNLETLQSTANNKS